AHPRTLSLVTITPKTHAEIDPTLVTRTAATTHPIWCQPERERHLQLEVRQLSPCGSTLRNDRRRNRGAVAADQLPDTPCLRQRELGVGPAEGRQSTTLPGRQSG